MNEVPVTLTACAAMRILVPVVQVGVLLKYRKFQRDPITFHGIGLFIPETGEIAIPQRGCLSNTQVFGQTMVKLAREIPGLSGITAAMLQETGRALDLTGDHFQGSWGAGRAKPSRVGAGN